MDDLIEALTILRKYDNRRNPTNCEHDVLWVNVDPALVSPEDLTRLRELHFDPDANSEGFMSFYFGSC
jgi:hypothetical protein